MTACLTFLNVSSSSILLSAAGCDSASSFFIILRRWKSCLYRKVRHLFIVIVKSHVFTSQSRLNFLKPTKAARKTSWVMSSTSLGQPRSLFANSPISPGVLLDKVLERDLIAPAGVCDNHFISSSLGHD